MGQVVDFPGSYISKGAINVVLIMMLTDATSLFIYSPYIMYPYPREVGFEYPKVLKNVFKKQKSIISTKKKKKNQFLAPHF